MISDNWFHKGKITYTFFLLFALFLLSNECLSSLFEKFCLKLNDSLSLNIRMCFPMLAAALIADEYFSFFIPMHWLRIVNILFITTNVRAGAEQFIRIQWQQGCLTANKEINN